jgi:hypothetical protein
MFSYIRHKTGCKICGFTVIVVNIICIGCLYYYVHKKVHEKLDAHSIIQFWLTCPKLRAWHAEFWMAHARVLKFYWLDFALIYMPVIQNLVCFIEYRTLSG